MKHSVSYAEALASIARVLDEKDLRVRFAVLAHDLGSVVARTVVHDKNFRVPIALLRIAENLIERRADTIAFVVGGNDE